MSFSRRNFLYQTLRAVGAGIGGVALLRVVPQARAANSRPHPLLLQVSDHESGAWPSAITPNQDFFRARYSSYVPQLNWGDYRLRLAGRIAGPRQLNMWQLEAMVDKAEYVTLECAGHGTGNGTMATALWEGVTLRRLLDLAKPDPAAKTLALFSFDGYSASLPVDLAHSDTAFLALRMNGEPLPPEHGYPLRLIVPGLYGFKSVKWLSMIEWVDGRFEGYWERQGERREPVIAPHARITTPFDRCTLPLAAYTIAGVANGGWRGIRSVQLSSDGGATWNETELEPPLSKWSWLRWRYRWQPRTSGHYRLQVRVIDRRSGIGTAQRANGGARPGVRVTLKAPKRPIR